MVHTIVFVTKRRPELSLEEFTQHYREIHGPLARNLPGLVAYEQRLVRHEGPRSNEAPDYDAVSTYVFESDEAAEAAWSSPEGMLVQEDTGRFMDWTTVMALPVTPGLVSLPGRPQAG